MVAVPPSFAISLLATFRSGLANAIRQPALL
jgi:hypothetical protein